MELTHTDCLRRGTEGAIKCRGYGSPGGYAETSAKVHVNTCGIVAQVFWVETQTRASPLFTSRGLTSTE